MYLITSDDHDFQKQILIYLKENGNYPKSTEEVMYELDTDDIKYVAANLLFLEFSNIILRTAFWYVNVDLLNTFWCVNGAELRN